MVQVLPNKMVIFKKNDLVVLTELRKFITDFSIAKSKLNNPYLHAQGDWNFITSDKDAKNKSRKRKKKHRESFLTIPN